MKVLWLINIILPSIASKLGEKSPVAGGWLTGISDNLMKYTNVELVVCFPRKSELKQVEGKINSLQYISFPMSNKDRYDTNDRKLIDYFGKVIDRYNPDIIHLFGTEFAYSLKLVKACKHRNLLEHCVVSIQGLIGIYSMHAFAGLDLISFKLFTLRELIEHRNIVNEKRLMEKRGKVEVELIKTVPNIIGRTDWDKACTMWINRDRNYFACNEILRDAFYTGTWDYDKCEKYTIYVSQAGKPIKGFHNVIEAIRLVKQFYPNVIVKVAGDDKTKGNFFNGNSYGLYLVKLIKKYNLENNIIFLGPQQELQVKKHLLSSHVYVLPSIIENSPNSLGEAMLLGVPTICSDVGGVKNLINADEGFIYPFDEPYMLAYYIKQVFDMKECVAAIASKASKHAHLTHDRLKNTEALEQIYHKILTGFSNNE